MLESTGIIKTETLEEAVSLHEKNFDLFATVINNNRTEFLALKKKFDTLSTDVADLAKRCKRTPSKGLVLFMLAAGIGYVIMNEKSKQDMRAQLLSLGKEKYGLNEPLGGLEDEGIALEAQEPESI